MRIDETLRSRGRARYTHAAMALAFLVLAGCGRSSDGASNAQTSEGFPQGVVVGDAEHPVRGIYAASGSEGCCWAGPDVRFALAVPVAASSMVIEVYEPKVGPFATGSQTVSLLDASGKVKTSHKITGGTAASLTFSLARGERASRIIPVHLHMASSYVPKDFGEGPDIRRLAIVVRAVSAH